MVSLSWPRDRTLFQEGGACDPRFDLRTDAAIVYGINDTLPRRVASWRKRGYRVHLMTGLAWGHYQEYLQGRWDGIDHRDEAQCFANGLPKLHGPDVPYMVPTESYTAYLEELLRRAIDAGVEAIFLEEPEFWSYTGYGPAFERAFAQYHGTVWRDPAADPQAFVQAARVKYALYRELLARLCRAVKAYTADRADGPLPCYLATHSLLNYCAKGIISPELSSRAIPECDGAIVQVWSHTARSQTRYEGRRGERPFEVAFLEYGTGLELARGGKGVAPGHLWFLADPIEDSPDHGWDYYRSGYQATIAASLIHPEVGAYEVMPWPSRVFTGRYPRRPDGPPGEPIPGHYASQLLVIANALRAMPQTPPIWDCGTRGLGILVSDTMLFRRGGPANEDADLSAFYGLALPLLIAGMPVQPVGLELLPTIGVPDQVRILLLSYDGMTPPNQETHVALAAWVRAGGALLCFGPGNGLYETLPDWWHTSTQPTAVGPWPDLFARLGLLDRLVESDSAPDSDFSCSPPHGPANRLGKRLHRVGAGLVQIEPSSPILLAEQEYGGAVVRAAVQAALSALPHAASAYREQSSMTLRRGPYLVAAAFAEAPRSAGGPAPLRLPGLYVDLFDGELPVRDNPVLQPGDCALLLDLAAFPADQPRVLAAAARVEEEQVLPSGLRLRTSGPSETTAVLRVRLPVPPRVVRIAGEDIPYNWDPASSTVLVRYVNQPTGVQVEIAW